ncbi:hypothetical protein SERLADRAFT_413740 [Serpula lacrymans var. lacrymans S7.9]|uniref:DUF6534 domain-containing protein n=1 Tax=Serpula lacrymans var. lacrymans (strain S7.9) TaxID=578457 RepID=F8NLW5_SERL9|nr:uncharacterized protein SERLADRAFT_413740 [Serpula lacrymans var. lacrymans S7.9]EGO27269.1 hypothetical protein SERLADRAFT_413740 [Serpula lacrymans var. lacrymans S7.9]
MAALDNTFGAALIGVVVSATLYGVTCVQTWYYFGQYPNDTWYIKLLVMPFPPVPFPPLIPHLRLPPSSSRTPYIKSSSRTQVRFSIASAIIKFPHHTIPVYTYLVTNFGDPAALGDLVWSLIVEVLFNGFTALMVQSFLAMRIWRLSGKSWIATGAVMILVFGEFGCVLAYVGKALELETFAQLGTLKDLSMTVNAVAAAGDVLIAAILCTLLQNSRTGFRRSDTIINKLILFSINTGLLTSICAVASLISITAAPTTFIYIAFYFCLGRLYCNSLLATLNARKGIRGESRGEDVSLSLQGLPKTSNTMLTSSHSKRVPNNISIKIDTTHEYMQDEYADSSPSDRDVKLEV